MKKIKIVNKKTFAIFVLFILLLLASMFFLIFKIIEFKRGSRDVQINSAQEVSQEKNIQRAVGDSSIETEAVNLQKNKEQEIIAKTYTEYSNQEYAYTITFPDNWYLSLDSSEVKPEVMEMGDRKIGVGGQTFWSNYKNIDEFSPEQKPEDFHLLGLTIYERESINIEDLAVILGFSEEANLQKNEFIGKGISGMEFVAAGMDEKNPLVMIIFQKDKRCYVFNLGFINGDAQAAEIMENIVKSFNLR